ncbi:hypothetical protein CBL_09552 [Carabus blaptoides fortunei]
MHSRHWPPSLTYRAGQAFGPVRPLAERIRGRLCAKGRDDGPGSALRQASSVICMYMEVRSELTFVCSGSRFAVTGSVQFNETQDVYSAPNCSELLLENGAELIM